MDENAAAEKREEAIENLTDTYIDSVLAYLDPNSELAKQATANVNDDLTRDELMQAIEERIEVDQDTDDWRRMFVYHVQMHTEGGTKRMDSRANPQLRNALEQYYDESIS